MTKHFLFIALSMAIHACALKGAIDLSSSDPNGYAAAETVLEEVMTQEQPCLNVATAHLPAASQQMAQTAYKAIQAAIRTAEATGLVDLPDEQKELALKALQELCQVADVLHATIHEADARAPSP